MTDRIIGKYERETPGPKLIFVAGIHGNEAVGIQALQKVFKALEEIQPSINGSVLGIAGNIKALEQGKRYIDSDLNRIWLEKEGDESEYSEKEEIIEVLKKELDSHNGEVVFFDLHSTSSESDPFILMSDTLRNRRLAEIAGIPVVLGIQEQLHGTMMDLTARAGFPTIIFEGGKSDSPETDQCFEGLIWKMMHGLCGLDTSAMVESKEALDKLDSFTNRYFEVFDKYVIKKGADFTMNPGYRNFQPVKRNEELAVSNVNTVRASSSGLIFMPLYQEQGKEGFFIAKSILKFWINFSSRLRRFNFHKRLHWLLGVYKTDSYPITYKIDQRIAFVWAAEVFHLLGYRKHSQDGPWLYMIRRENEKNPPTAEQAIRNFLELVKSSSISAFVTHQAF